MRQTSGSSGTVRWGRRASGRTRTVLVVAATLAGLLVAPTTAAGVSDTCQGRPATIVADSDGGTGTEGDDVIVSHNTDVDALGGDDLICLDAGTVNAGDGDDSILVTPSDKRRSVRASLGAGDDRFVGSGGSDYVVVEAVSPGADNISTGAGNDIVRSGAGWGPANLVVDLGAGRDDLVLAFAAGSSAQVQAGEGTDDLFVEGDPADYVFDLGTGLVTGSGVAMASLPGFENYEIHLGSTSGLRVLGTPGRDIMVLAAGRLDLALGDGPDDVFLDFGRSRIPAAGVLDLGPGEDSVQTGKAQLVVGDLARGSLRLRTGTGRHGDLALVGVEQLRTIAPRVVLRGGAGADRLSAYGCHVRIRGGAGPDRLVGRSFGLPRCSVRVNGGAGGDRLVGGRGDDRLGGGRGSDEALGGTGIDTCRAEHEISCER